jgi:putative membrane protein
MSSDSASQTREPRALAESHVPAPLLAVRAAIGGVLMGLANLVPGISGGTMLLAAGVYPQFISGIAELTTGRYRRRSVLTIGTIAGAAGIAILLLAGPMKTLVVEQRWMMYSLFIGLTLGGVPLVWKLARPMTPGVWGGAVAAFCVMLLMQLGGDGSIGGDRSVPLLFVSGLAGASAMILPGVSGGYLALLMDAMWVIVPVGIGVVVGIVGVSNALKWLFERYEKATLGALLGLLFGAVVGLWPFQMPVAPQPGDVIKGRVVSVESAPEIEQDDWRLERFDPTGGQAGAALGLLALGLGATLAIARLNSDDEPASES